MPLVLTGVLSHLELTGAVQVDQVLVVSTSSTSLLLSRESGPLLPNGGSETSSEGLLARAEPALRDYCRVNVWLSHERQPMTQAIADLLDQLLDLSDLVILPDQPLYVQGRFRPLLLAGGSRRLSFNERR